MKAGLLFFLLLIAGSFPAGAQKIHFTDSANQWRVLVSEWTPQFVSLEFSFGVDTLLPGGLSYRRLVSDKVSLAGKSALIREDTVAGKVYAKNLTLQGPPQPVDTNEEVLYDYNLVVGDTFTIRCSGYEFRHQVVTLDSVMINGGHHRVWELQPLPGFMPLLYMHNYKVIEGIGCLQDPLFPYFPGITITDVDWQLVCFRYQGQTPGLDTPVHYNDSGSATPFSSFDNLWGCFLGVNGPATGEKISVSPQPAVSDAVLTLPQAVSAGSVIITSITGQTIYTLDFQGRQQLVIPHPGNAGIYFYQVRDRSSGWSFTGKIIFQ